MTNPDVPTIEQTCRFLSDPRLDGRCPGTEGHEEAKQYLLDMLSRLGLAPLFDDAMIQPVFDGDSVIGENLGAVMPGTGGRYLLLGAHYDHFAGIPGADDNAAALSILIETARQLRPWQGEHHVALCFFDLEEPPYFQSPRMGSVQFAQRCSMLLEKTDCSVILDLCGHDVPFPGRENIMFVLGAEYCTDLARQVRANETDSLPTYMFRNGRIGDMSDHYAFRERKVPFLFFSCGWWKHYHRPTDVFENLNLDKMQRFADYLAALVRSLDGVRCQWSEDQAFWREEARSVQRLTGRPAPASEQATDAAVARIAEMIEIYL